jgi:hypothetical protein
MAKLTSPSTSKYGLWVAKQATKANKPLNQSAADNLLNLFVLSGNKQEAAANSVKSNPPAIDAKFSLIICKADGREEKSPIFTGEDMVKRAECILALRATDLEFTVVHQPEGKEGKPAKQNKKLVPDW